MTSLPISMLTRIAWRNIWRNHRRTLVMIAAISIGVWAMVVMTALMVGMVDQMVRDSVRNLTGHIQIHAPRYRDDPAITNSMAPPDETLLEALSQPKIKAWSTRVRLPAVITSERESVGVMLVGIDPASERQISFIGDKVTQGHYLESPDDKGILIGKKLAERLETKLGHRLVVMSQDPDNNIVDRGFRVVGIFDTELEATETGFVFIGKHTAQKMLRMGNQISELALISDGYRKLGPLTKRVHQAAPGLEVLAWTSLEPYMKTMLTVMDGFAYIWYIIVFLAMSFGLVNTLLMAVFERTREIGLVQALGMAPRYILLQVLIESLFLLLIGLAAGNLISLATLLPILDGWDISAIGTEGLEWAGMSSVIYPKITLKDIITSNIVVIILGIAASLYPAWRASRYVPVEAITRT